MKGFGSVLGSVYTHVYRCTLILLCLVGFYVFQWPKSPSKWPCLSLKNGPNVNVVIFYIKKGFYCERFLGCFGSVYTHFYRCTLILLCVVGFYVLVA